MRVYLRKLLWLILLCSAQFSYGLVLDDSDITCNNLKLNFVIEEESVYESRHNIFEYRRYKDCFFAEAVKAYTPFVSKDVFPRYFIEDSYLHSLSYVESCGTDLLCIISDFPTPWNYHIDYSFYIHAIYDQQQEKIIGSFFSYSFLRKNMVIDAAEIGTETNITETHTDFIVNMSYFVADRVMEYCQSLGYQYDEGYSGYVNHYLIYRAVSGGVLTLLNPKAKEEFLQDIKNLETTFYGEDIEPILPSSYCAKIDKERTPEDFMP